MAWFDLHLEEDENTCSILHLVGFGEQSPTYDEDENGGTKSDHASSFSKFKAHLRDVVRLWDEGYDKHYYDVTQPAASKKVHRMAYVDATTCSLQPRAEKYLEKLGFQKIGPFSKLKHSNTVLTLWVMAAPDFIEAIKE